MKLCSSAAPVQFSCSVVSNSLRPHGLQHARPPSPSPTPGVYSNSCSLSQWCHPAISSYVVRPLLLPPSIFPSIRVFSNESALRIRWPKYWSFSFTISPSSEYSGLIPLGRTGWISLQSKGLSRVFSNNIVENHQFFYTQFSPVQFSRSVVPDSLWPHELQQARPPCPSPTPRVYSNSCSSSWRCHPAISSYVISFSSWLQSFPESGSFPMSQFFSSRGQSFGVSASPSVLPVNIQDLFLLRWTGWISLLSKGLSRSSPTAQFKNINSLVLSFLYGPTLTYIHDYWKNHSLD